MTPRNCDTEWEEEALPLRTDEEEEEESPARRESKNRRNSSPFPLELQTSSDGEGHHRRSEELGGTASAPVHGFRAGVAAEELPQHRRRKSSGFGRQISQPVSERMSDMLRQISLDSQLTEDLKWKKGTDGEFVRHRTEEFERKIEFFRLGTDSAVGDEDEAGGWDSLDEAEKDGASGPAFYRIHTEKISGA
eukprot:CAMPEP_0168433482 /NCGR_PEP_ID=MMETSP0228-20121227/39422_1 /TAXON_ID=133427 /ORGANISM="Protoceratium reticulatum, Strain CCCM 535 (=CCMP 1889)" /LENGTH=191 /DNA_ID=CAMNT_0008447627 /DNA_START=44 /DNA_END=616 /DNA_ORIENTATION=-